MFLAVTLGDVLFSLVAIAIVFLVLALLVLIVSLMSKIKFKEAKKEVAAPVVASAPQKKFTIDEVINNYYSNVDVFGDDMFY